MSKTTRYVEEENRVRCDHCGHFYRESEAKADHCPYCGGNLNEAPMAQPEIEAVQRIQCAGCCWMWQEPSEEKGHCFKFKTMQLACPKFTTSE